MYKKVSNKFRHTKISLSGLPFENHLDGFDIEFIVIKDNQRTFNLKIYLCVHGA